VIVLSGALVLVALVLLVFGAVDRNLPYVYASVGVSALSLLLLAVGILQRRGEVTGEDQDGAPTTVSDTSAERMPALVGAGPGQEQEQEQTGQEDGGSLTTDLLAPAAQTVPVAPEEPARTGSRRVLPVDTADGAAADDPYAHTGPADVEQPADAPAERSDAEVEDGDLEDAEVEDDEVEDDEVGDDLEAAELEDDDLEEDGAGVTVLVVSGRPRYHVEGCRVLRGKDSQPLDRDDARTHGFSPCGVCKPDAAATAEPSRDADATQPIDDVPFAQALSDGAEPDATSAPADLPEPPVLSEVEPAVPADDVEPPAELRGDDPADDPTVVTDDEAAPQPAPVAVEPDEAAGPPAAAPVPDPPAEPDLEPAADAGEPVVEPVTADQVPVSAEPAAEDVPTVEVTQAPTRRRAPRTKAPARRAAEAAAEPPPAVSKPAQKAPARKGPAKKAPAPVAAPAPEVRRPLVRAVRADALRLGAPSTGATTTRISARGAAPAAGASVVVVPDRDRFHRPACRFVRDVAGATTLPKASAARQGYAPCGVCKP